MSNVIFEAFEREIKAHVEAMRRLEDNIDVVREIMILTQEERTANLPPPIIQEQI